MTIVRCALCGEEVFSLRRAGDMLTRPIHIDMTADPHGCVGIDERQGTYVRYARPAEMRLRIPLYKFHSSTCPVLLTRRQNKAKRVR